MRILVVFIVFIVVFTQLTWAQTTASKQVTTFKLEAPQLDTIKQIWIYLPKDYKDSDKSYPVLYMHDGQNLFDRFTAYSGEWEVDEFLDGLDEGHSIIVGIEHGGHKRINELTPFVHEDYGGGQGDDYLNFIIQNLKPHIDAHYRTLPDPGNTSIFGSSLGGLISFYAAIKYPDSFGKAGIFSPAFWINPEIYEVVKSTEIKDSSRFFFLAGTDEGETMIPKLKEMLNLLNLKGLGENQWQCKIIEGGQHNESFWKTYFGEAYNWLNAGI